MVPAPAQGVMMVVAKKEDRYCIEALASLNHEATEICTQVERDFLKELEGGCTAPIGALATIENEYLLFKGILLSLDGQQTVGIDKKIGRADASIFGKACGQEILTNGGKELMQDIKIWMSQ